MDVACVCCCGDVVEDRANIAIARTPDVFTWLRIHEQPHTSFGPKKLWRCSSQTRFEGLISSSIKGLLCGHT